MDLKETLSASGRVEAVNRINMIFQKSGTIEEIYVTEGEFYKKGEPLITLGKKEEENTAASKKLQVRIAENNFRDMENQYQIKSLNYEVARTSLENTKLLYERNLRLLEAGGISQKEMEDFALRLREAEAKEALAAIEYKSYSPGGIARERALIDVENAKIQLSEAELEVDKKVIKAPFDGQVLTISREKYSNVQAGEIGIVFAEEKSFITTDIDERDNQKVKKGQKAFIQFLNSNEILEGTVRDISPVIDRTKGTVRVRIDLNQEVLLKTDTGVNVEIIVNEYKDEIIVPAEFVFLNPARIIVSENGQSKVVLLKEYERAEGFYILKDSEIKDLLGKDVIAKDLDDGEIVR